MAYDTYRISIQVAENGYTVEVPDLEEIEKKRAAAKKDKSSPSPYVGDCTKSFVAKSAKEALSIVSGAINSLPDMEYDSAFENAAKTK